VLVEEVVLWDRTGLRLAPYHGRRLIHLPRDPTVWPDSFHLDRHRRNTFASGRPRLSGSS
jgi:hypothetical protein